MKPVLLVFSARINSMVPEDNYNVVYFLSSEQKIQIRITDKRTNERLNINTSDFEPVSDDKLTEFDREVENFIHRREIERNEKIKKII
jgi:hypothetical protein